MILETVLEQVKTGQGQVVDVVGAPGGKYWSQVLHYQCSRKSRYVTYIA